MAEPNSKDREGYLIPRWRTQKGYQGYLAKGVDTNSGEELR